MLEDILFGLIWNRLLMPRPRVRREGDTLVIGSDFRSLIWTLGGASRKIIVEPKGRCVRVRFRRFWFFREERRLGFERITEVTYDYHELSFGWARRTEDLYVIGLKLVGGELVSLFRVYGQGDFVNDGIWPDFLYWGDMAEAAITRGNQESQSRELVDLLGALIEVPVGSADLP